MDSLPKNDSDTKYNQNERISICYDIATQLRGFQNEQGVAINLFNDEYSYVKPMKKIFNEYIHDGKARNNIIMDFEEIGKKIEFTLPIYKHKKPLCVIRMK